MAAARRIAACIVLLALSAGCGSAVHPAQPAAASGPHCQRVEIPVRLSASASVTVVIPVPRATTQAIHVPVLLAGGQNDALDGNAAQPGLSCATASAILAREKASYAPQACLRAYVLPMAGHSINLHPDAAGWLAAASNWVKTYVDASTLPASCLSRSTSNSNHTRGH